MDEPTLLEDTPPSAPAFQDDEPLYEEIDGRRVEMPPMSTLASKITKRLVVELDVYARSQGLGEAFSETLFRLPAPRGARNRRPDVVFISFERWPRDRPESTTENAWAVVPDLFVEVVSPTDFAEEIQAKVLEYFAAGARAVWVIYPLARCAVIYDSPTQMHGIAADGTIEGGTILPGFAVRLAQLFGPPPAV